MKVHRKECARSGLPLTQGYNDDLCICAPPSSSLPPEQKLDLLMAEPREPGEVVHFRLGYPNSPKTYDYAAIRTAGGQWYVSGADSPQGYRWPNLIAWIEHKRATLHTMYLATDWESLL